MKSRLQKEKKTESSSPTEQPKSKPPKGTKKKENPSPQQQPVVVSKPPAENPWKKSGSGDSNDTNVTKDFPTLAGKKKVKSPGSDKGKEDAN